MPQPTCAYYGPKLHPRHRPDVVTLSDPSRSKVLLCGDCLNTLNGPDEQEADAMWERLLSKVKAATFAGQGIAE